jgi:hypothetical protein
MDVKPRDGDPDLVLMAKRWRRAGRGKTPAWLLSALDLLNRDTRLSDREIARRLQLSHSTLVRNKVWKIARQQVTHAYNAQ